jgi:hypothetical protein
MEIIIFYNNNEYLSLPGATAYFRTCGVFQMVLECGDRIRQLKEIKFIQNKREENFYFRNI